MKREVNVKEDKELMRNGDSGDSGDSDYLDHLNSLIERIELRNLFLTYLEDKLEIEAQKRHPSLYSKNKELAKGYVYMDEELLKTLWVEARTEAKLDYKSRESLK